MTSSAWQTGARMALFGMIVNSIFAIAKILGGFFGHAYVLIADGIESGLDVAGSFVIWSGLKVAARPPDASHPYGHGKAEPIAAMIVAVGVVAAAVGLAIQSVREIFLPHHAPAPYTLVILVVVIMIKETLFRYVNRIGRDIDSTAVQTDAWHHRSDALTSAAAFIGISVALIGQLFLPAQSSPQMASGFCGRRFTKSWTPRRGKSLSQFARLLAQSLVS